ncbi:MAG: PIN domain-containing protein [Planctomycetota bacterium]|nr:PIN domain-containing protein [Planctomycetota bacterium]
MRRIRVYVDTSVFGGTQDDEFADVSRCFFERVKVGDFIVLVSRMILREVSRAPKKVQLVLESLDPDSVEYVEENAEIDALANAYIEAGILGQSSRDDAVHVATATIAGANLVLSWNFKHIVNYDRIHKYNAINLLNGYQQIEIRSPLEMTYGDENKDI